MTDDELLTPKPTAANDALKADLLARTAGRMRFGRRVRLAGRVGVCLRASRPGLASVLATRAGTAVGVRRRSELLRSLTLPVRRRMTAAAAVRGPFARRVGTGSREDAREGRGRAAIPRGRRPLPARLCRLPGRPAVLPQLPRRGRSRPI